MTHAPSHLIAPACAVLIALAHCTFESRSPPLHINGDAVIAFERGDGSPPRLLPLKSLTDTLAVERVISRDPYYHATKTYWALPAQALVAQGIGASPYDLKDHVITLRAADGYQVQITYNALSEAAFAIDDVDHPGFLPIGNQRANPGPLYLIWKGESERNMDTYPQPWSVVFISVADAKDKLALLDPHSADPRVTAGFAIFQTRCIHCHAINRQGGRVGPDLNVPRNVTEYRDDATLRAFIKDPQTYRYSNMPANLDLNDDALNGVLAYLHAMAARKQDADHRTP